MVSQVSDVPYGYHFEHQECWTVLSTSDTAIKCICRNTDTVKMLKSTLFEGRIRARSKTEFIAYFAAWMKAVEDRGLLCTKEEQLKIPIA